MKKISVVITTYNGERYIEQQLQSIVNQSVLPDEIIISDDCSTDNTVNILKKWTDIIKNEYGISVCTIYHKKNIGFVNNFREVILKARGKYIFLCDQDDMWENIKVERMISVLDAYGAWLACTGIRMIDGDGAEIKDLDRFKSSFIGGYKDWSHTVKKIPFKRLLWGNFSPGCTYCFTKEVQTIYEKIYNGEIPHDYQLIMIAANAGKAIYVDEPLQLYRIHTNNTIGVDSKEKKRKRHLKPINYRFVCQLAEQMKVNDLRYARIVLYLRIPKIRSMVLSFFNIEWKLGI